MNYDKNYVEEKARQYSIRAEMYEKQERLLDILENIRNDPVLNCTLALKGGTAINLFVMEGPRLSMDIDLDYAQDCSKEEMLKDRKLINSKLQNIFEKGGYILRTDNRISHILDSLKIEYQNIYNRRDYLKMDINYLDRCHILPIKEKGIKAPWAERNLSVNCVDEIEIFATKMVALCTRAKARDLYDVVQLKEKLNLNKFEKDMLHKCIVFYSAIGTTNIKESLQLSRVNDISQYDLKTQVLPLALEKHFICLDELRSKADEFINEMHILTCDDERFIDNFQNGYYKPEQLFDGDQLENILNHPMALYKTEKYRQKTMQTIESECLREQYKGKEGPELGD